METQPYEIKRRGDGRFLIYTTDGRVLDDANGYGYRDRQKAEKAAWYRFKGGRSKTAAAKKAATTFWRLHPAFALEAVALLEMEFKAIALGDVNADQELTELARERSIEGFDPAFLKYLP